ncbi:MAG: RluA family pseudouridine synthase, partial [Phycisphaerales bacterium]
TGFRCSTLRVPSMSKSTTFSGTIEPNERITYRTVHEDEHLLVVEKPTRLVTTPGVGHEHDTLLNGLMAKYRKQLTNMGNVRDHGMLHRLDKETSGLLVVALNQKAYDGLRAQFEQREIKKYYWAVCLKAPREHEGVIRKPISDVLKRASRYTSTRTSRIDRNGKPAVTAYRVIQESALAALIEARPITGRLHQIRVHLDSVGAAVLGDDLYGPKIIRDASPRLALHSHRLSFTHPISGERLDIRTQFPRDLRTTVKKMNLSRPEIAPPAPIAKPISESE